MLLALVLSVLLLFQHVATKEVKWDCHRPWPELELFLPVNTLPHRDPDRNIEYSRIFLRSLLLFWPLKDSKTKLLVLADAEHKDKEGTQRMQELLSQHINPHMPTRMAFNEPVDIDQHLGHDRQQRLMFYADKYTDAEFVGFVDTDCMLTTYVDREDLFEDGKPVVNGRYGDLTANQNGGRPGDVWWATVPHSTHSILGILESMRCMSYFPVIVRTQHIREMREYMEQRHGKPFDALFKEFLIGRAYSQFNIMCTYLFDKHRDEYRWYVHDVSPGWDYRNPPPAPGQESDPSKYTAEMRYPKPRIALHSNYRNFKELHFVGSADEYSVLITLQAGVCFGPPFPKPYRMCNFYNRDEQYRSVVYEEFFKFEMFDWTRTNSADALQKAMHDRFLRIEHCEHEYLSKNLTALMTFNIPKERDLIYTELTGKSMFIFLNGTLFQFPNYDTFVKMDCVGKPTTRMERRNFLALYSGQTLPPLE